MTSQPTATPLHVSCHRLSQNHQLCGCESIRTCCLAAGRREMSVIWVHELATKARNVLKLRSHKSWSILAANRAQRVGL